MQKKGYIHLYVGDGKGKTTAAAGLALRALGAGQGVIFAQFLKGRRSGEAILLEKLGARTLLAQTITKFIPQMTPEEITQQAQQSVAALENIRAMMSENCDLVVLDEAVDAVVCGMLPLALLQDFLRTRPAHIEVVLTGRRPPDELSFTADYYTDFVCRAHPYEKGVSARQGIEW